MRHVKINGIWYRLAEDAEGQHYAHNREPLRPPNAQLVQGDSTDFQLRPDTLLWRITDWSGGEGQLKWTTPDANRSYILQGVNPFSRPGSLQLGYKETLVADTAANTTFYDAILTVSYYDYVYYGEWQLWLATRSAAFGGNARWSKWDTGTELFGAHTLTASLDTLPTLPPQQTTDGNRLYYEDPSALAIKRVSAGGVAVVLNDQCYDGAVSQAAALATLGPYVYVLHNNANTARVFEISKTTVNTTTPETALYEADGGEHKDQWPLRITAGDGKIYFFTRRALKTVVHEVVPSSAAGAGYGRVLTEIEGFRAETIWFSAGTIFLMGVDGEVGWGGTVGADRQIFYIDPQGQYGTLGSVRGYVRTPSDHGIPYILASAATGGQLGRVGILLPPTSEDESADDVGGGLFELDTLSGSIAAVGRAPTSITTRQWDNAQLLFFNGMYFGVLGSQIVSWDTGAFSTQVGVAMSPAHDFNLASTKILDAIEVSCEPLPANNIISIGYSLDGAAWVDTNVVTATGATSGSLVVSTDSSTKTFNNLQIRVKLTGSGGNSPVVRSIDTFARVNRKINTWDLLLDISDDSAPQGYSGQQILDNLLAVGDNTVIDFVDRYGTHIHDSSGDQYDVIIDAMSAVLDQPGEGVVAIRIVETI